MNKNKVSGKGIIFLACGRFVGKVEGVKPECKTFICTWVQQYSKQLSVGNCYDVLAPKKKFWTWKIIEIMTLYIALPTLPYNVPPSLCCYYCDYASMRCGWAGCLCGSVCATSGNIMKTDDRLTAVWIDSSPVCRLTMQPALSQNGAYWYTSLTGSGL